MQLQAGTVMGGMTEVSRPDMPRSIRPESPGRSSRQRSSTRDGSAQSSPTIITRLATASGTAPSYSRLRDRFRMTTAERPVLSLNRLLVPDALVPVHLLGEDLAK